MGQTSCRFFILLLLIVTGGFARGTVLHAQPQPGATPAPAPVVGEIRIDIISDPEDAERLTRIAESLIFLKEGEPFSDEWFSESIEALTNSTIFQSIDVPDPDWSQPPITLVFRLTPFPRIRNIIISGGFPLLEREIRNVMTITTGKPYVPEALPDQVELIETLFQSQGFIDPEVRITAEKVPGEDNYVIRVDIDKGRFYSITKVILQGTDAFIDLRLKIRLASWQSSFLIGGPSRYTEEDVEEDVETLRSFYWQEGYCDAEVQPKVEKDPRSGTAAITYIITEGPLYDVDILGNDFFWTFTLKKDLVIYERGNRGGFGLRKSVRNMEGRYRDAGFLDIDVRMEDTLVDMGDETIRKIRFIITEGPRSIVDTLIIEGNAALPEENIRNQILTGPPGIFADGAFDPDTLGEDIRAIKTLYLQQGYLKAAIRPKIDRGKPEEGISPVNIRLNITEGPRTLVSGLAIKGTELLGEDEVAKVLTMRLDTPYRPYLLNESKNTIAARISEKGYPHVTVEPQVTISRDNTRADIVYQVAEGPRVEMGNTFFIGNFKTKGRILRRQVSQEAGEPFSLKKMLESQRSIRDVNALESVQFQTVGLEERAERVDLLAEVHEKKPYYVQFTTGYDTWRRFYVDTAIGDINFWGLNNEVKAGVQWSQIGYLAQLGITDPSLWGTRIAANGTLYAEEVEELNQEFGVRTYGAATAFTRDFLLDFTATLNIRLEQRDEFRTGDVPVENEDTFDPRAVLVTTPGLVFNDTDSFVRPTRGVYSSFRVDISRGLQNSLDDFLKYQFDLRYYFTPLKPVTLAFRTYVGYINPFGPESNIPQDQLFYLGGTTDIRGFGENRLRVDDERNPVGGRTALLGSVELRYDLGLNFELVTFYDRGTIRDALRDAGTDDWRAGAGAGLRYITPIGPIGLMYGRKLDRRDGESSGEIHFSIGYTF